MAKKSKKSPIYVTRMAYKDCGRLLCIIIKKSIINTFGLAQIKNLIATTNNIRATEVTDAGYVIFFKTKTREVVAVNLCKTLQNYFQQKLLAET